MAEIFEPGSPFIKFFRLIPECRLPQRADRSAGGSIPTRAFRYCEPMATASAFGWYVFPPMSFSVMWDGGTDIIWTHDRADGWHSLDIVQFPDFAERFDQAAPPDLRGFSPTFLGAMEAPVGGIQLWSGLLARTAPGWSLLVRQPANLARSHSYECWEGLIETDRWFGPLFINIRLTRINVPIKFDADFPFLQVQPIHRISYGEALDNVAIVTELGDLGAEDWDAFRQTNVRPVLENPEQTPRSHYAAEVRRRRRHEKTQTS
jgi:Family of unknown function (DUF6065)